MTSTSTPRTWLISTGTADLVRPLAEAALDTGARLVLAATSPADLVEFADLPADPVRMVALDGADPGSADAAVRTAVEAFGRLDVVVTAPGAVEGQPLDASPDDVRAHLDAELLGTVALTRAALPVLRRQGSGSFLHLASPAAPAGAPAAGAAVAARRAVEGYLEALREEVAPSGVRLTIAQPGAVPGNPDRIARVLADVATMEHPPLHLVLGSDTLRRARQVARGRVQELDVWGDVSRSTDLPGAPVRSLDRGLASVLHLAVPAAS